MIRAAIVGYGNLGRGAELAIKQSQDIELVCVFTRRSSGVDAGVPVVHISKIAEYKDAIDVMLLCGGSATDLPEQTPCITEMFNTVDTFDTHKNIPEHFGRVDAVAKKSNTVSIISTGWDPGLFSIMRLLGNSFLPCGNDYTFWGRGVSQGHSDAVRRVPGVAAGVQYTVPSQAAIDAVRSGSNPELSARDKHTRVCYIVAQDGADKDEITRSIVNMPNYFADYDTTVHFVTLETLKQQHSGMPHGGMVMRTGNTVNAAHNMEFSLSLQSNPEFTASVLVSYARAAVRLKAEGRCGAFTVFDVPLGYLSPKSPQQLMAELL